jgi:predicted PurR-regulated permease PerM
MENSIKGLLVTLTLSIIFIVAFLNFIVLFPQEQGVDFNSNSSYLVMKNINNSGVISSLDSISSSSTSGFSEWDVEVGQMGSNSMKGSVTSIKSYSTDIFSVLNILAQQVFKTTDENHPILWVLGILGTLTGVIITVMFIKFIRTGE